VNAARLGLAAVNENRHQFAEARTLYETVEREAPDKVTKLQANARLRLLATMKQDQYVSPQTLTDVPPMPREKPAGTQSSTQPATGTTSMPASMPSASIPASGPSGAPATLPTATPTTTTAPAAAP
jgi:hypothetical protein